MKIRNGFVSNSSSTCFVIVANYIRNAEEAVELAKEGKNVYVRGVWLDQGADFFSLKKEMYDFILSKSSMSPPDFFQFLLVHLIGDVELEIKKEDINWDDINKESVIITYIEADDFSCKTLRELEVTYGEIK